MDDSARQLSLSLESVARALAEWTVSAHEEADGTLPRRYGEGWRRRWVADVESRVRHLAQAVAVGRPEIFEESVAWSSAAFAARAVPAGDLQASLRAMREVLAEKLPAAARDTAVSCVDRAVARLETPVEPRAPGPDRARLDEPCLKYLEALLDGRRDDAVSLVVDAVEGGLPVRDALVRILHPAQVEVGRMWHGGVVSVADEHFVTGTTELVMSLLRPYFKKSRAAADGGRRIVATAVTGDLHSLGVRMVAEFFEMDGWQAIYLGANTPGDDVIRAVAHHQAHLLAISATSFLHLREVGELIDAVRSHDELSGTKIIVGGAPFNLVPDLWSDLGADGSAESAEAAVEVGNRLVGDAS